MLDSNIFPKWIFQISADILWFGKSMKEAVQLRRLHHQLVPNAVKYEEGYDQVRKQKDA